jgi:mono/diheme cytochrome c family protein
MKTYKILVSISLVLIFSFLMVSFNKPTQEKWIAPKSADKIINPIKDDVSASKVGKKIYAQLCAVCHGANGKGDGIAAASLNPKPANFKNAEIQKQTDGALFWKITNGRAPMASYKESLSETQRWQLINYIRTFN